MHSLGIRKRRYDWQRRAILRNLSVIFNYTTYLSFIVTGKWSILPPDFLPYSSSTLWGLFFHVSCLIWYIYNHSLWGINIFFSSEKRRNIYQKFSWGFTAIFHSYADCLVPTDALVSNGSLHWSALQTIFDALANSGRTSNAYTPRTIQPDGNNPWNLR